MTKRRLPLVRSEPKTSGACASGQFHGEYLATVYRALTPGHKVYGETKINKLKANNRHILSQQFRKEIKVETRQLHPVSASTSAANWPKSRSQSKWTMYLLKTEQQIVRRETLASAPIPIETIDKSYKTMLAANRSAHSNSAKKKRRRLKTVFLRTSLV